ncbi:J domain-containing protein [Geobacter sp.]|uniref:J domain-containing protein n=1 Tax=Geobacter sp. TaxID=46610 RepID=UPI00261B4937|nr:J domain-containing protein [Geobacter sp.]
MDDLKRCYELLGLERGASAGEVRHRFRELVSRWHPDRFSGDPERLREAEERLRLIIEAHRRVVAQLEGKEPPARPGEGTGPRRPALKPVSPGASVAAGPNLLFLLAVGICAAVSLERFGATQRGWAALLELAFVPLLFSVAWNLTARRTGGLRRAYVGFTVAAMVVALLEGALPPAVPGGGEPAGGGIADLSPSGGALPLSSGRFGGAGEQSFVPAARAVPAAPLAPLAPAAPEVPLAPVPPVVPSPRP